MFNIENYSPENWEKILESTAALQDKQQKSWRYIFFQGKRLESHHCISPNWSIEDIVKISFSKLQDLKDSSQTNESASKSLQKNIISHTVRLIELRKRKINQWGFRLGRQILHVIIKTLRFILKFNFFLKSRLEKIDVDLENEINQLNKLKWDIIRSRLTVNIPQEICMVIEKFTFDLPNLLKRQASADQEIEEEINEQIETDSRSKKGAISISFTKTFRGMFPSL